MTNYSSKKCLVISKSILPWKKPPVIDRERGYITFKKRPREDNLDKAKVAPGKQTTYSVIQLGLSSKNGVKMRMIESKDFRFFGRSRYFCNSDCIATKTKIE